MTSTEFILWLLMTLLDLRFPEWLFGALPYVRALVGGGRRG